MRRIAIHVHVDHRDLAQPLRVGKKLLRVSHVAEGAGLVPDLHDMFAAVLTEGRAHALGVVDSERHRLFLINVLARVERGAEVFGMQVLRGRDHNRVDGLVLEQPPIIEIRRRTGRETLGAIELLGVDIAEGDDLGIRAGADVVEQLRGAVAEADEADADALI